jgi:dTDP-4-dehydrorhamnose 3,5-epimerase
MIDGVRTKKLRVIPDERGRLMEVLRADDELFLKFGQVYITTAYPGVVKAWHWHAKQADSLAVVFGMARVGLYDPRPDSPTKGQVAEFCLGVHNPLLVQVPPGVMHGFKCIGTEECIVLNCPTETYNYEEPDEHRLDPYDNDIPFDWHRKDG